MKKTGVIFLVYFIFLFVLLVGLTENSWQQSLRIAGVSASAYLLMTMVGIYFEKRNKASKAGERMVSETENLTH